MSYVYSLITNFRHLVPPGLGHRRRTQLARFSPIVPTDEDPQFQNEIRWQSIPDGTPGTIRTLTIMTDLAQAAPADPVFRAFAEQFHGWQELLQWVRAHFLYREEHQEVVRAPRRMLDDIGLPDGTGRTMWLEGDCDDVSTFLAAALKVLGYAVRFLAIRASPDTLAFEHVVTQVFDRGNWITLDPTVPPGTTMIVRDELIQSI